MKTRWNIHNEVPFRLVPSLVGTVDKSLNGSLSVAWLGAYGHIDWWGVRPVQAFWTWWINRQPANVLPDDGMTCRHGLICSACRRGEPCEMCEPGSSSARSE